MGMWDYWRTKYCSRVEALEETYPQLLSTNEELRIHVATIKAAEARIDQIMESRDDG